MAARTVVATGALITGLAIGTPASSPAQPPVGSCPPSYVTRTLDFFDGSPPGFVEAINKNGDPFLCTKDFPAVNGKPGGRIVDNTGVVCSLPGPARECGGRTP